MRKHCLAFIATLGFAACGGGGPDTPTPPGVPAPDPFAEVDRAANAAFSSQSLSGMGLAIYDAQGVKRFERMYGDFAADRRIAVASASKMVAGLVIMRLVTEGYLTLDSTTGEVLGWAGPQGEITLRQLLSFTSGMEREAACTLLPNIELADCVAAISQTPLVAPPGTRFDYGSTHLQVAARMAEVTTGASWNDIFAAQIKTPLRLGPDLVFYTAPRMVFGTSNPLVAGGLRATMNEYARLLALDFNRGTDQGNRLIGDALFDAQATEPYPDATIGFSPIADTGLNFHYGLAAWLECPPPAANCPVISSPGAFGFTPWFDREAGYYAIIAMEVTESDSGVAPFSVQLAQDLKPLIRAALR